MYLAFLGLVVLLLVSVFIAQATGCYKNVKDIADQMANYSCARLLTQTSTMLPECLFNAITVSSPMCNSVHCTISIHIYNYLHYHQNSDTPDGINISSTFLPQQKKCPRETSPYVWSDWPCHRSCACCPSTSFLRSIWQIIPSV